jgi:uncharacterized protein
MEKLSALPQRIWTEVLLLYAGVIAAIALFKAFSFIPFIQENLGGIAGLLFLFVPLEFLYRKGEKSDDFGISWRFFGRGLAWALILIAVTFPLYIPAYQWWFGRSEFHFALPGDFWKQCVGFVLLVALRGEVFNRVYMQPRLDVVFPRKVKILGAEVGWSLVVTAGLFALGHLVDPRADKLGTFFPGLVFGWLRAKTGSIGGAVLFHAACNIWAQVLRYGTFGVP